MASPTKTLQKQTILDDLVNQFSDPLSFFRELIQNSVDAGSGEVEVRVEFQADEDSADGTMVVHVDDWGEGMDRQIIETKLTRLFSSAKDDDYTKIGRFGIGFVSVFAIEPQAVCVDTGRTGDNWRVLFDTDKSYELYALDRPIEGTKIRIFKPTDRQGFEEFVDRARQVILSWCKHVAVPIYFQGEELGEPFDIDSACKIHHREEGTRLVMGFVDSFNASYGYYNQGLTLKEGDESPWPHIAFKIDSRYLEHTLTRDQLLEDKNFHKAWKMLEQRATEVLPAELIDAVEQSAANPRSRDEYQEYCRLLVRWLESGGRLESDWEARPLIATIDGEPTSIQQCRRAARTWRGSSWGDGGKEELFYAEQPSELTQRLPDDYVVLRTQPGQPLARLLMYADAGLPSAAHDAFVLAHRATAAPMPGTKELGEELAALVAQFGARPEWVGFGSFEPSQRWSKRLALPLEDRFELTPADQVPACTTRSLAAANHLVINLGHPLVRQLVRIAQDEPEWAAFNLLELMLLGSGLDAQIDSALVTRAIERRKQRWGA